MELSPKSNYEKKNSFLVLTPGKFLEALGSVIGTGSILCLSFSLSNRVIRVFLTTQLFIHSIWTNSFATRRVGEGSGRKLVGNEYPRVVYICSRSWPLAVGSHERGYLVRTSASRPGVPGSNPIAAPKSYEVYPDLGILADCCPSKSLKQCVGL